MDWMSRHPRDINTWSKEEKGKHGVDDGEEIRLNRLLAVQKLDRTLSRAGITGGDRCSEQEIAEVGAKDLAYSTVLALVREGKNNKVKLRGSMDR